MRSDSVKKGFERSPHRSLFKATGLKNSDIKKPLIAIANSYTDIVPGHVHLDAVAEFAKNIQFPRRLRRYRHGAYGDEILSGIP